MREFKLKKWVAAGLIVSMPYSGIVSAAGLGGMNVLSQLGQPFAAEIDLVNVSKEELATLGVAVAGPEAYRTANLQYNPALLGMRLSIERRPDGRPFIRATSPRAVAEPFLDILLVLSWQGGRIVREYSALLDPPGLDIPAPAVTAPVVAGTAKPAPAAKAPAAVATPAPATAEPATRPASAPASTPAPFARPIGGSEYAVKQGDMLGRIAAEMKPEGISLDQMMIGLLRANPDAFINNNINLVKAGKILKAPEPDQLAAIAPGVASQEVRAQSANWNAYRAKVADTAPAAAVSAAAPATQGKITARVDDKAAGTGAKDVVVVSKGEGAAAKGKDGKAATDRVRALEEDLTARDKALAEAKERVAILEETVKKMQKLAELKNPALAAAQQAGKGDAKADAKAAPKADVKAEPAKVEPPKPDAPKAEAPNVDAPKVDAPKETAAAPKADAPKPVAKAPLKAAPPPPPEPTLMDTVMANLLPIGGGAAVLAGLGFWALRRRKKGEPDEVKEPAFTKTEALPRSVVAVPAVVATAAVATAAAAAPVPDTANVTDVVDPIEEAQVYIDHGRDSQAEEILKEAMGKDPLRQDVQVKLLEVYAARGDKGAFNKLAREFNTLTGGVGDNWERVAGMGHAVDPANALYPSTSAAVDIGGGDAGASVDLDLGASDDSLGTTTDILLEDQGAADDGSMDKTMVMATAPSAAAPAAPVMPDFNLDLPEISVPAAAVEMPPPAAEPDATVNSNMMDFSLDLPSLDAPAAPAAPTAPTAPAANGGLDFNIDMSGISLDLDNKEAAPANGGGEKGAHWNDVQQKFDLARAYQDMGDKDGAKEILREVLREGDDGQKAEAQKVLDSIK